MISPSSAPLNIVEIGTATKPAWNAPRMVVSIGMSSDITSSTRSSRRNPRLRSAALTVRTRPLRSAYLRSLAPPRTATSSPRPSVR